MMAAVESAVAGLAASGSCRRRSCTQSSSSTKYSRISPAAVSRSANRANPAETSRTASDASRTMATISSSVWRTSSGTTVAPAAAAE